jgi:hypothetical protein
LIPEILEYLLNARAETKKEMKTVKGEIAELKEKMGKTKNEEKIEKIKKKIEKLSILYSILDKRQNGFKVSSNSVYGAGGSDFSESPFYPMAECTTALGRYNIQETIDYTMKKYGDTNLVYGDSVTGNTPILIKDCEAISIIEIQDLAESYEEYPGFKLDGVERKDKEKCEIRNVKIWTRSGWSNIKKVIKHRVNKKIYRVTSSVGVVDVTEDHSLLKENGEPVKPKDLKNGEKLLTGFPPIEIDYEDAFIKLDIYKTSDKLEAQQMYYFFKTQKIECIIKEYNGIYNLIPIDQTEKIEQNVKIELLYNSYNDFVYDIETEDGSFHAGIGELIIKNTDSAMFHFSSLTSHDQVFKRCHELEKCINEIFPPPMYLEFENISGKYLLLKKKNYIKEVIDESGAVIEVDKKGVVSKRRDNCALIREQYMVLVNHVMQRRQIWEVYRFLENLIDDLLTGKIELEKFIITKSIKENYKTTNLPHLAVANKMKDRGKYVASGTRIPYLFVETEKYNLPQYMKAEDPDYYIENQNRLKIDYLYYLEKQLVNPMDELLLVGYKKKNVLLNLFKLLRKDAVDIKDYFKADFEILV